SGVLGRIPGKFVATTAANAAFSELRRGRPENAVSLLRIVASHVLRRDEGMVQVALDDLPGIARWVDDQSVWQSSPRDASPMVAAMVRNLGDLAALPPHVADLAEFYAAAAE